MANKIKLTPEQARALLAKRQAAKEAFNLETYLFPEQLAAVKDPAKHATWCCSVRSGKTVGIAADLVHTALTIKGSTGLYISLTRSSAKKIVWPELKAINKRFNLGAKTNNVELTMAFPNGSFIYLNGANNDKEIERLRGLSNVAVAYIDESQAFRSFLQTLVDDILVKRLYDLNGRLRLVGTPGPVPAGYFYEACQSSTWSHHMWTMHQNIWLEKKSGKTPQELIDADCARRNCSIDEPSIQRECFGRWVLDSNSLLLHYDPTINDYQSMPPGVYTAILGIDLGLKDCDSLSLLMFCDTSPNTYLVEEILTPNQLTDDLARQIQSLMRQYSISEMPVDAGGLGAKIVEDLKARYGLPLTPADKLGKMANYKHLDNALRNGTFKAKKTTRFAQDCNILEKDPAKSTPERLVVRGHSDAVDSCLYAFKLSPAYNYAPPVQRAKPGTPEYQREVEEKHLQAAMEKVKKEKDALAGKGSEFGSWNKDKKGIPDWNKW